MLNNLILGSALRRLREDPDRTLLEALTEAHAFRLATGAWARKALAYVVAEEEWDRLRGEDAATALELADKV